LFGGNGFLRAEKVETQSRRLEVAAQKACGDLTGEWM
jgi:hypothetical protein